MINRSTGKRRTSPIILAGLMSLGYTGAVYAHAQFTTDSATPPRYNTSQIKQVGPCGSEATWASYRTNRKGIFVQGETIALDWMETVDHRGSYEFDFSPANDEGFVELIPPVADTQDNTPTPHYYSQTVQLNVGPCDACTLRMRQNMDNLKNYYYSCADIVIVSGSDVTPPQEVTGLTASSAANGVQLAWSNPTDTKGIIVVRSTATMSAQPSNRTDYLTGDSLGNAQVVYKGTGTGFTDTGVAADTDYTYAVFAYDSDYNYNSGVSQSVTTAADTNPAGGSGGTDAMSNDSGGGAGSWVLILLATLLISQRPAWRKLW